MNMIGSFSRTVYIESVVGSCCRKKELEVGKNVCSHGKALMSFAKGLSGFLLLWTFEYCFL